MRERFTVRGATVHGNDEVYSQQEAGRGQPSADTILHDRPKSHPESRFGLRLSARVNITMAMQHPLAGPGLQVLYKLAIF